MFENFSSFWLPCAISEIITIAKWEFSHTFLRTAVTIFEMEFIRKVCISLFLILRFVITSKPGLEKFWTSLDGKQKQSLKFITEGLKQLEDRLRFKSII